MKEKIVKIGWSAPANIALIKYWGKRANQLPENSSLSITLDKSFTSTFLIFSKREKAGKETSMEYYFHGAQNSKFENKIAGWLNLLQSEMPCIADFHLVFQSENNFPHSAGIASSASSMAAVALCLVSMEQFVTKRKQSREDFFRRASAIARLGSGSASRSVYGGIVTWGATSCIEGSSDFYATPYPLHKPSRLNQVRDIILVVNAGEKQISSSSGHALMMDHPYREGRKSQAEGNLFKITEAIATDNYRLIAAIAENEALSLHALLMTSVADGLMLQPNTLHIIEEIKQFRESNGLDFFFTMDAGPNVHLIYYEEHRDSVLQFVKERLIRYCENGQWIDDRIGSGPRLLTPEIEN